MFGDFVIY